MPLQIRSQLSSIISILCEDSGELERLSGVLIDNGYSPVRFSMDQPPSSGSKNYASDLFIIYTAIQGVDTLALCRELRNHTDTETVPIILIISSPEDIQIKKAFEAGCTDCLLKPFEPEQLLARITASLKIKELNKRLEIQTLLKQQEEKNRSKAEMELEICLKNSAGTEDLRNDKLREEIEKRLHAEKTLAELRENHELFRRAIEISQMGIFNHDHITDKFYTSSEYRKIWGWEPDEDVSFSDFHRQIHPEDIELLAEAMRKEHSPDSDGYLEGQFRITHRDGTVHWLTSRSRTFFKGEGPARHNVRTTGVIMDITEKHLADLARQELEHQLLQSQKLNTIGLLAGGIAHDFNNLLVPILGYAELGKMKVSENDRVYGDLEIIQKAAEKAAALTRQLLAFSRQQVLEVHDLDLNEVINELRDMLSRLISENIDLKIDLSASPCITKADRTQIEQILLNLVVNARDAMPGGGILAMETDIVNLDESYTRTHPETETGTYVVLSISDNGQGMEPEVRDRIFEPFFTTKEKGSGTGLGLSTVFGIVKQHGGNIWLYSEPGKGTTFRIYLPVSDATHVSTAANTTRAETLNGSETILLVEDDLMVRSLARETLEYYGYRVLEADTPEKGIEIAMEYREDIHLLLTDIIMPEMSGHELNDRIRSVRPGVKVLFMSGYSGKIISGFDMKNGEDSFIQKPFTVRDLLEKIRSMLDS